MIDTIKGTITYLTASVAILGAMWIGYQAWSSAIPEGGGRDIAILFGFLGLIVGSAVTFLFQGEAATRATRAAQSSTADGAAAALAQPPTAAMAAALETTVTPEVIAGG